MWSLVLIMFNPLEPAIDLGVLGVYDRLSECTYYQNISQSEVVLQDTNGILFCIKDYERTN
jgi:hypothetical protein